MRPKPRPMLPAGVMGTVVAAFWAGVSPATIRSWVRRGLLQRWGGTERYPLYWVGDLAAAKAEAERRDTSKQAA